MDVCFVILENMLSKLTDLQFFIFVRSCFLNTGLTDAGFAFPEVVGKCRFWLRPQVSRQMIVGPAVPATRPQG